MKAAVSDGQGGIVLAQVAEPEAAGAEALIAVQAMSLNRGDVKLAAGAKQGSRLGWDFFGRVRKSVGGRNTSGLRVAGLLPNLGAWGEQVVSTPDLMAAVPEDVLDEQAAALPVAGLTALYVLEDLGTLIGRRVLVTGASGGVGHLACQLAKIGGADVTGLTRSREGAALLAGLSIASIEIESLIDDFDFIVDSVGGDTLAAVLGHLRPNGTCITLGATAGRNVALDAVTFYRKQQQLRGFGLFPAITSGRTPRLGLKRLFALIAGGRLKVEIGYRGDWSEIATVAAALAAREFLGKAVLKVTA